jgi:hypothetical protein
MKTTTRTTRDDDHDEDDVFISNEASLFTELEPSLLEVGPFIHCLESGTRALIRVSLFTDVCRLPIEQTSTDAPRQEARRRHTCTGRDIRSWIGGGASAVGRI